MPRLPSSAGFLLLSTLVLLPSTVRCVRAEPCGGGEPSATPCCLTLPLGVVSPEGGFLLGCANEYVLVPGHGGGRAGAAVLLDLPPCPGAPCGSSSGADAIRCWMVNGYPCCLDSGLAVSVMPGNKRSSVLRSLETRWQMDTDQRAGTCYADYHGNGSRLVEVWLVTEPGPPARGSVIVAGRRARFFLKRLPAGSQDDLPGEFLGYAPES